MSAGPGIRWAAMGSTQLFHLGAGEDDIAAFCERYTDSFHRWWDDLGDPRIDDAMRKRLIDGMAEMAGGKPTATLAADRDALLLRILQATMRR